MNDDIRELSAVWMSDRPVEKAAVFSAVDSALDKDRATRARERRIRIGALIALACLLPILLWAAAHGVTPLVRGAYALMAAGAAALVSAEWMYLDWASQ